MCKFNNFRPNRTDEPQVRTNYQIRVPNVRVIHDDKQLGVMPTDQARRIAQDAGLDLVEIAPQAKPPVCRIMDYSKYKYEQQVRKKESAKKQRDSQIRLKEIRLRPGIGDHDVQTKVVQARKFLEEGKKVQFNLQFKGAREMAHKDQGFEVMNRIVADLELIGNVEKAAKLEGNRLTCRIEPKTK